MLPLYYTIHKLTGSYDWNVTVLGFIFEKSTSVDITPGVLQLQTNGQVPRKKSSMFQKVHCKYYVLKPLIILLLKQFNSCTGFNLCCKKLLIAKRWFLNPNQSLLLRESQLSALIRWQSVICPHLKQWAAINLITTTSRLFCVHNEWHTIIPQTVPISIRICVSELLKNKKLESIRSQLVLFVYV